MTTYVIYYPTTWFNLIKFNFNFLTFDQLSASNTPLCGVDICKAGCSSFFWEAVSCVALDFLRLVVAVAMSCHYGRGPCSLYLEMQLAQQLASLLCVILAAQCCNSDNTVSRTARGCIAGCHCYGVITRQPVQLLGVSLVAECYSSNAPQTIKHSKTVYSVFFFKNEVVGSTIGRPIYTIQFLELCKIGCL
jgi:hypothetical protein